MTKRIIQKIKVEGKNLNDLFNLDCVYSISKHYNFKSDKWEPRVELWRQDVIGGFGNRYPKHDKMEANLGDEIIEYSNHRWKIRHKK